MLIAIDPSAFVDIQDDKDFFTKVLCEESISCLPASVNETFASKNLTSSCCPLGIWY